MNPTSLKRQGYTYNSMGLVFNKSELRAMWVAPWWMVVMASDRLVKNLQ